MLFVPLQQSCRSRTKRDAEVPARQKEDSAAEEKIFNGVIIRMPADDTFAKECTCKQQVV